MFALPKTVIVPRCYDSHCHFIPTGQIIEGLSLFHLSKVDDLKKIKIKDHHFRGKFLVGFGWDHFKFNNGEWPTKELLDRYFPDIPTIFTRVDGHTSWFNSAALNEFSSQLHPFRQGLQLDNSGKLTGIAIDQAKIWIDSLLPQLSSEQLNTFALSAQHYFLDRGFTHIRDMTCDTAQFEVLKSLENQGSLKVFIELNFNLENISNLVNLSQSVVNYKSMQLKKIRPLGIKVFIDGSLGSDGALLSTSYYHRQNYFGEMYWSQDQISQIIQHCWQKNLEVSFHTIGDQAVDVIVECALNVQKNHQVFGILNLEHVEVIRSETIEKLKQIKNVRVHFQPSHFLSDQVFLKSKLGPLYSRVFRWQELMTANVPFYFGSDSPIEEPNFFKTIQGINEARTQGVPGLAWDQILSSASHHDQTWGNSCFTKLNFESKSVSVLDSEEQ